jgi:hypothetical protein
MQKNKFYASIRRGIKHILYISNNNISGFCVYGVYNIIMKEQDENDPEIFFAFSFALFQHNPHTTAEILCLSASHYLFFGAY